MAIFKKIRLKNFLSFGENSDYIHLRSLNIFIGQNSSGKSNFIEAFRLLKALPDDLPEAIRRAGGYGDIIWKGKREFDEIGFCITSKIREGCVTHTFEMSSLDDPYFYLTKESVKESVEKPTNEEKQDKEPFVCYDSEYDKTKIAKAPSCFSKREHYKIEEYNNEDSPGDQSILNRIKDPEHYPQITSLGELYKSIRVFSEWDFRKGSMSRVPQRADLQRSFLSENADNLSLIVTDLINRGHRNLLLEKLVLFNDRIKDITTDTYGGVVQLYIHEQGLDQAIPATRLSDGTLRFLCLVSIFYHPEPPPLICMEEPELGLHPDILPAVAEMMKEASERTQLIVTTHSDILVSAFTETPEDVLVCESTKDGTEMRRLDGEKLKEFLKKYTLGEAWRMGEIGGNRW